MKNWVRIYLVAVAVMVFGIVVAGKSFASEAAKPEAVKDAGTTIALTIKDHLFSPAQIEAPAGQKITLTIENKDATPEEFESHDLHREKVIAGGSTATIVVGPLKPGVYKFFGEFHEDTAKGTLTVK